VFSQLYVFDSPKNHFRQNIESTDLSFTISSPLKVNVESLDFERPGFAGQNGKPVVSAKFTSVGDTL
jgi:hypothetical protein